MDILELLPAEREALLETLRSDLRSERERAVRDPGSRILHLRNIRSSLRLLEALTPKSHRSIGQICKQSLMNNASAMDAKPLRPNPKAPYISKVLSNFLCLRT
jgi:hypothetical protein